MHTNKTLSEVWSKEEEAIISSMVVPIQHEKGCTPAKARKIAIRRMRARRKKEGQTDKKSVSPTTINSIPPVTGDGAKELAKRQKELNKRTADNRLTAAEAAATRVRDGYEEVHRAVFLKFITFVKDNNEDLVTIREFFRRRKKDQLLFGKYGTGQQWSDADLNGTSYDHVCKVLNKVNHPDGKALTIGINYRVIDVPATPPEPLQPPLAEGVAGQGEQDSGDQSEAEIAAPIIKLPEEQRPDDRWTRELVSVFPKERRAAVNANPPSDAFPARIVLSVTVDEAKDIATLLRRPLANAAD